MRNLLTRLIIRAIKPAVIEIIERVTKGAVRRQKLRPDWREIWPELAEAAHA